MSDAWQQLAENWPRGADAATLFAMFAALLVASLLQPRLVAHAGREARVDACSGGTCATWVRFNEPRSIYEVSFSRSGDRFFVWSQRDGHARDLDIFETPHGASSARLLRHFVPGFGGSWQWLEGDRLLQIWGCGTSCANLRVYDTTGILFAEVGSWAEASPDRTRVVMADAGGHVVLIDVRNLSRRQHTQIAGAWFPLDVKWSARGVAVTFDGTSKHTVTM